MAWALLKSKVHASGEARLHYYTAMTSSVHKKGIHPKGLRGMAKSKAPGSSGKSLWQCLHK